MNIQEIRLDLDKRVTVAERVVIGQGDKGGTTIVAHIFDHGVAYDLTGKSAMFEMRIPRQTEYVRDNCTVSGNTITYVVDEEHAAAAYGTTDCAYFDILIGDSVIASTARFTIDILRSARDGAVPATSWDTEIDELIQRGEQAVLDAEQAVGDATSAVDAANQAIARIEPTIEQAAEDAAEQATADAEQRIQDAIEAMGEISELAVPEMSADVRGGAKLEQQGGLALRDGALGIGSLVQESDGYARGGLAEVTAKGHAEQVSTTGKNLLPNTATSQTINGVTFTVNDDGSVTANGTSTGNVQCIIARLTLAQGAYAMSGCPAGGNVNNGYFLTNGNNGNDIGSGVTFSADGTTTYPIYIGVRNGTTVSNLTFYPQLELGSTATEYEPYTGEAPSPSPDYPQEIQVVRGRNLLDIDNAQVLYTNVATYSISDGSITVTKTAVSITTFVVIRIPVRSGAFVLSTKTTGRAVTRIGYCDANGSNRVVIAESSAVKNPTVSGTLSVPSNKVGCVWFYADTISDSISSCTFTDIQLELGTTPTPYVPYGHVGMEAHSAKNMLDERTLEQGGISYAGNVEGYSRVRTSGFIPVTAGNTYAVSALSSLGTVQYAVNTYTAMQNNRYGEIAWAAATSTFTVPAGVSYVRIVFRIGAGSALVSPSDFYAVQLERDTATEYEPHIRVTPIPLPSRGWVAGLPDGTADSLRLDGAGKVEWEIVSGESDMSLNMTWSYGANRMKSSTLNSIIRAMSDSNQAPSLLAESRRACAWSNSLSNNHDGIAQNPDTNQIVVYANDETDYPTGILLYPLATPVTEDCGYVDMPAIPSDATVTIRELDDLGIKYFIDDSILVYGRQMYQRARSEYADRLEALEAAVADLVTGA